MDPNHEVAPEVEVDADPTAAEVDHHHEVDLDNESFLSRINESGLSEFIFFFELSSGFSRN